MQLLAIISGEYGRRHRDNIIKNGPKSWQVHTWEAPKFLPPVIDYPEDYLPESLPPADLILSFAEHKGVAELIPDIAEMIAAKAVIAAIDNDAWLPRGLARQLIGWCERIGVVCITPKPLCALTEEEYGVTRKKRVSYVSPLISEFATHFGQPDLKISVDPSTRMISKVDVVRDTVCGCAHHVSEGLIGISADDAGEKSGLLHHHYPCLASMVKDPDFNKDTLMHASGNLMRDNVEDQVKPFKRVAFFKPADMAED